ncbi:MAG: hypothetical protein J3K34DRAFT_438059 [Monoraphidium minutum]|nr:MAG: hypothetical protein J3K34DRAFT_438059 [Monoraphidium minutum]
MAVRTASTSTPGWSTSSCAPRASPTRPRSLPRWRASSRSTTWSARSARPSAAWRPSSPAPSWRAIASAVSALLDHCPPALAWATRVAFDARSSGDLAHAPLRSTVARARVPRLPVAYSRCPACSGRHHAAARTTLTVPRVRPPPAPRRVRAGLWRILQDAQEWQGHADARLQRVPRRHDVAGQGRPLQGLVQVLEQHALREAGLGARAARAPPAARARAHRRFNPARP